jgi:hypothetical protein
MLMTFLLVLLSTFLVLRWSVRQPQAAHSTYTSLEKLFLRPGEG